MTPNQDPDSGTPPPPTTRLRHLWTAAGLAALALGLIGIVLPVLPTTPLVLLAAFCFSKGSPRLRAWIANHSHFGPAIADWEATGAIPRKVKGFACAVMALTFAVSVGFGLSPMILIIQAVAMGAGATYVLTRPDA